MGHIPRQSVASGSFVVSDRRPLILEAFRLAHAEAGGRLAGIWRLPPGLIDAIRYHHEPEAATVDPELAHLIYLADLLISRFLAGQKLERLNTEWLARRLRKEGVRPEQLPFILCIAFHARCSKQPEDPNQT